MFQQQHPHGSAGRSKTEPNRALQLQAAFMRSQGLLPASSPVRPLQYSEGPTYQHVSPSGLPGFLMAGMALAGWLAFLERWAIALVVAVIAVALVRSTRLAHATPERWVRVGPSDPAYQPLTPK